MLGDFRAHKLRAAHIQIGYLKATILGTWFGRPRFESSDRDTGCGRTFGSVMIGFSNFE